MTSDDQIYVIGSSNTDMVVKAARLPAAGDCFNGALAAVLSHGRSLGESIQFASRAAAVSVTRLGAQTSLTCADEILDAD